MDSQPSTDAMPPISEDQDPLRESTFLTSVSRNSSVVQDVIIPAHLLQTTGSVGSTRDSNDPPSWQPQQQPVLNDNLICKRTSARPTPKILRPAAVKRSSTTPSRRSTLASLQSASQAAKSSAMVSSDDEESSPYKSISVSDYTTQRRSWRLSPTLGVHEHLTFNPTPENQKAPGQLTQHEFYDFASQVFTNPFEGSPRSISRSYSSWSTADPFLTRVNSFSTDTTAHDSNDRAQVQADELGRAYFPAKGQSRRGTMGTIVDAIVPNVLQKKLTNTSFISAARSSSMRDTFEKAKERGKQLQRTKWAQITFEYGIYTFIIMFVYFVLLGIPLWRGAVWWLYWVVSSKFVFAGGFSITLGIALFYAFAPLFVLFERDSAAGEAMTETKSTSNVQDTALMIPCYKSAGLIAATLEAALKVFPPSHIFVIANGNSPEPLDNTEEVCRPYGVNHIWSPIGSKIVAQFVGCYAAKSFTNVLLIDDDCALPENFPVVADRLKGNVKCIGYTIKSVGPNSSKGNYCQQAQDLEYKLSGLQREFAGRFGSATFPHGAISLWERELLLQTFHEHPGFNVSEDWFFGHVARELGCRIKMCSSIFVETETPTAVFLSSGGSRGGFGEMTIFKQRFKRWNFFSVNGMWYNMAYIFGSWKLGWWEIGAKIFVFQEVYETLLYLLTPFILPISFYVRPSFCGILLASTVVMYLVNVIIFNEVHLRRKGERIEWFVIYIYYLPYKIVLTGINVASCYWSLWKYARYFAKRHPKVTEDVKAVEVIVRLEEDAAAAARGLGRRLTVCTIRTKSKAEPDNVSMPLTDQEVHLDSSLGEPYSGHEVAVSGLITPTRLMEGISVVDFTTTGGREVGDAGVRYARNMHDETSSICSGDKLSATAACV